MQTSAMLRRPRIGFACLLSSLFIGCLASDEVGRGGTTEIRAAACTGGERKANPWHIANLYDCETESLYVPYQLWTGAEWDGRKDMPCMHAANLTFVVNNVSETRITGPVDWRGQQTWARKKTDGSKTQHFACHEAGIGRVHDSRYPNRRYNRGRCKFPAGEGWPIGKRRECRDTAIRINRVELDPDGILSVLHFDWWFASDGRLIHDHTYRYQRWIGMTTATKR